MKQEKISGIQAFDSYYSELYGNRWNDLKNSLYNETIHCSLQYPDCSPYFLDPASVCAALCLPLNNAADVLDLCAAPGGKTLVLCGNLISDAVLSSNERSPERKNRLVRVIAESLVPQISERVKVTCSDGGTWCKKQTECYDSILLDAPCSSERHVLNDPKYLNVWTPSRIKTMSMEQWALLSSAWRMLRKGGYLLYSTCALAKKENDEIIERLIKKFDDVKFVDDDEIKNIFSSNLKSHKAKLDSPIDLERCFLSAQKTEYGFHILPDSSFGAGPIYFCLVKKELIN